MTTIGSSHIRRAAVAIVLVGLGAITAACGGPPQRHSAAADFGPGALKPGAVWIGTATASDVAAFSNRSGGKPEYWLHNPDLRGTPLTFLVDGENASGEWVKVRMPVRPNGTKAWVRTRDLKFTQTQYAIQIDLSDHKLEVTKDDEVVLKSRIGIGEEDTPTPAGDYYVKELIRPEVPHTLYGAFVFGLSGYSEVLDGSDYDDDTGRLGIHGTNDPKTIGKDVSKGCIRVPDKVVKRMAKIIPLGTPVSVSK
jgi:hypothetical protein